MSTWKRLAGLELEVEDYALEGLREDVSSDFERLKTIIHSAVAAWRGWARMSPTTPRTTWPCSGRGRTCRWPAATRSPPSASTWPASSCPGSHPRREVSRRYRTWAYESAALDLALGQAGLTLHGALGRHPERVRFVVSLRLGEPPTLEPITSAWRTTPTLRFKLDPTSSWDEALIAGLVRMDVVDSVDFKGLYVGSIVDQPADPVLYKRVVEAFPQAWIEDPALTPRPTPCWQGTASVLLGRQHPLDRRHQSLPTAGHGQHPALPPGRAAKPPGGLRRLRRTRDRQRRGWAVRARRRPRSGPIPGIPFPRGCARRRVPIGSIFPVPPPGLESSPLAPAPAPLGFRWG